MLRLHYQSRALASAVAHASRRVALLLEVNSSATTLIVHKVIPAARLPGRHAISTIHIRVASPPAK